MASLESPQPTALSHEETSELTAKNAPVSVAPNLDNTGASDAHNDEPMLSAVQDLEEDASDAAVAEPPVRNGDAADVVAQAHFDFEWEADPEYEEEHQLIYNNAGGHSGVAYVADIDSAHRDYDDNDSLDTDDDEDDEYDTVGDGEDDEDDYTGLNFPSSSFDPGAMMGVEGSDEHDEYVWTSEVRLAPPSDGSDDDFSWMQDAWGEYMIMSVLSSSPVSTVHL